MRQSITLEQTYFEQVWYDFCGHLFTVITRMNRIRCHTSFRRVRSVASTPSKRASSKKTDRKVQNHSQHWTRPSPPLLACHVIAASNTPATYHSRWPIQRQKIHRCKRSKCSNTNLSRPSNSIWLKTFSIGSRSGCVAHWHTKQKFHAKNWKPFYQHWHTIIRRGRGDWCGFGSAMIREKILTVDIIRRSTIGYGRIHWRKR